MALQEREASPRRPKWLEPNWVRNVVSVHVSVSLCVCACVRLSVYLSVALSLSLFSPPIATSQTSSRRLMMPRPPAHQERKAIDVLARRPSNGNTCEPAPAQGAVLNRERTEKACGTCARAVGAGSDRASRHSARTRMGRCTICGRPRPNLHTEGSGSGIDSRTDDTKVPLCA